MNQPAFNRTSVKAHERASVPTISCLAHLAKCRSQVVALLQNLILLMLILPAISFAGQSTPTLALGYYFTAAVKADGSLWTWGDNSYGQLGDGTTVSKSTPVHIAGQWKALTAGMYHVAAIKTDGTLWTWGRNSVGMLGNGGTDPLIEFFE
jgi:hypothetical protein